MAHISDIKLIRTDTTLDLSQKAEKGMLSFTADMGYKTQTAFLLLWTSAAIRSKNTSVSGPYSVALYFLLIDARL